MQAALSKQSLLKAAFNPGSTSFSEAKAKRLGVEDQCEEETKSSKKNLPEVISKSRISTAKTTDTNNTLKRQKTLSDEPSMRQF